MKLLGFAPLVDKATHTLIFGSFPGVISLQKKEYYGHPKNQFWKIMGIILNAELYGANYLSKQEQLLAHGFGLWDVYRSCNRKGSLDSKIKNPSLIVFSELKKLSPRLHKVCFNGKEATKFEYVLNTLGYKTIILPSTSPAYTLPFDQKTKVWKEELSKN